MSELYDELQANGFIKASLPLFDASLIKPAYADAIIFDQALSEYSELGFNRVPYLLTESIKSISRDKFLVATVNNALNTENWVMWGPNIRTGIPNQANRWHVDLESVLWPSITVAIGLNECKEQCATWFIPGSAQIGNGPSKFTIDCENTQTVLNTAKKQYFACRKPEQITGFTDGSYYIFDAKTWHKAAETASISRSILFLHFQQSEQKRIPHMLDYKNLTWSLKACPYIASANNQSINIAVERPPIRHILKSLLEAVRRRF